MKGGKKKLVQSKLLTPDCDTCWGLGHRALVYSVLEMDYYPGRQRLKNLASTSMR
jgi:hypothetical protein